MWGNILTHIGVHHTCDRHHPRRCRIGGWGIGLARHDGGELPNGIKMFQFGNGRSQDCTS
jgi:hypothetical protein